ncbi:MAG: ABC transporter ATP-binding protein, partial [Ginsengibacter sp.]
TRELIRSLAKEGKTIILASHLLDEVEKVCTHVAILQRGKLITSGHVDDVLVNEDIIEVSCSDNQRLANELISFPGYKSIKPFENRVQLILNNSFADLEQVNKYCFEQGLVLNHLQLKKKSLESKFFELTSNEV